MFVIANGRPVPPVVTGLPPASGAGGSMNFTSDPIAEDRSACSHEPAMRNTPWPLLKPCQAGS